MKFHKKIGFALSIFSVFVLATFTIYNLVFKKEISVVQADNSQNIFGWAWSSNIGWISFNSTNCDPGDNGSTDSCAPDCPDGTSISPYGVNIDDATGNFSGYAWSSNVGWISFEEDGSGSGIVDFYDFNTNCDSTCEAVNNCTACLNRDTGNVYGWAKILSMGDDGWIKLSDSSWSNGVTVDMDTGVFSGYAWNSNSNDTGVGWISFNCETGDEDGSSVCDDSDYRVEGDINLPPMAIDLTAPNWSPAEACGVGNALIAKLGWVYEDDDTAGAYRIILTRISDGTDVLDTGKCDGLDSCVEDCASNTDGSKCKIDVGWSNGDAVLFPLGSDELEYNISYRWTVEVWDSFGLSSGPVEFNTDTIGHVLTDSDGIPVYSNCFNTFKYNFPIVNRPDYFPDPPSEGVETQFTDTSEFYFPGNVNPFSCIYDDHEYCVWHWTVDNGTINDSSTSTPIITFNNAGNQTITLNVKKADDLYYSCTKEFIIITQLGLPVWHEIKKEE